MSLSVFTSTCHAPGAKVEKNGVNFHDRGLPHALQNAGTPIQALGLVKRTGSMLEPPPDPQTTQTVLNNVSLDIDGAGLTAIVGPSGAGKTSLLYVLSGLDRPDYPGG